MKTLPFTATTAAGTSIRFHFPLHALTESADNVAHVLTQVLGAIDGAIQDEGVLSDGDIMQALTMALAVRTRMVEAAHGPVHQLASQLVTSSLAARSHSSEDSVH